MSTQFRTPNHLRIEGTVREWMAIRPSKSACPFGEDAEHLPVAGHINAAVFGEARSRSITFTYNPTLKILFTKAEGLLSLADLLSHLDNERYREALKYRELVDASAAWTNVTPEEARQLVLHLRTMPNGFLGPKAVVTKDSYFLGMARMASILSELEDGPMIGVFRSLEEAMEWLEHNAPVL
jgi:hypothetical protein